MKQIEPIQIWDNGTNQSAEILNAYAVNVTLGVSATFYYSLMSDTKQTLATGNLTMSGDAYADWTVDNYAWDWVAEQLNLVIVGDWVEPIEPIIEPIVKESLTVEPIEETGMFLGNLISSDLNQMLIKGA